MAPSSVPALFVLLALASLPLSVGAPACAPWRSDGSLLSVLPACSLGPKSFAVVMDGVASEGFPTAAARQVIFDAMASAAPDAALRTTYVARLARAPRCPGAGVALLGPPRRAVASSARCALDRRLLLAQLSPRPWRALIDAARARRVKWFDYLVSVPLNVYGSSAAVPSGGRRLLQDAPISTDASLVNATAPTASPATPETMDLTNSTADTSASPPAAAEESPALSTEIVTPPEDTSSPELNVTDVLPATESSAAPSNSSEAVPPVSAEDPAVVADAPPAPVDSPPAPADASPSPTDTTVSSPDAPPSAVPAAVPAPPPPSTADTIAAESFVRTLLKADAASTASDTNGLALSALLSSWVGSDGQKGSPLRVHWKPAGSPTEITAILSGFKAAAAVNSSTANIASLPLSEGTVFNASSGGKRASLVVSRPYVVSAVFVVTSETSLGASSALRALFAAIAPDAPNGGLQASLRGVGADFVNISLTLNPNTPVPLVRVYDVAALNESAAAALAASLKQEGTKVSTYKTVAFNVSLGNMGLNTTATQGAVLQGVAVSLGVSPDDIRVATNEQGVTTVTVDVPTGAGSDTKAQKIADAAASADTTSNIKEALVDAGADPVAATASVDAPPVVGLQMSVTQAGNAADVNEESTATVPPAIAAAGLTEATQEAPTPQRRSATSGDSSGAERIIQLSLTSLVGAALMALALLA